MGIRIDIFAIDNMDINEGKELYSKIKKLALDNSTAMRLTHRRPTQANIERIKNYSGGNPFERVQYINKLYRKYENQDIPYVSVSGTTYYDFEHNIYPKEYFASSIQLEFEGIKFPAPVGYEKILKIIYGNDYMKVPKKDPSYRINQSTLIHDPDRSYTTYTEDEVFPIENN